MISPQIHLLGLFPGEGVGPELSEAACSVLSALEKRLGGAHRFSIRRGGVIGYEAMASGEAPLPEEAIQFCRQIFADGGVILAGPGGDRFVYQCRRELNLFYKLNPLVPTSVRLAARRMRDQAVRDVDILVVRDNSGGIYQGDWESLNLPSGERVARQDFHYRESQVLRVGAVACEHARRRRGHLTLVTKPNGIPAVSSLWQDCIRSAAREHGLQLQELEVDYATFALIQHPQSFDVVLTSNLFGDILSDVGGVLLGARSLCYGASFSSEGHAIYQTNHGAAFDIAGQDLANPVGHLLTLAMALEQSFHIPEAARLLRHAIETTWRQGYRSQDLAEPDCRVLGTRAMTAQIVQAIETA